MTQSDRMSLHLGERMAQLRRLGFYTGRKMHPMVLEAVDQYLEAVQKLAGERKHDG